MRLAHSVIPSFNPIQPISRSQRQPAGGPNGFAGTTSMSVDGRRGDDEHPKFLRAPTIFQLSMMQVPCAVVTAKTSLRALLGKGSVRTKEAPSLLVRKIGQGDPAEHGIDMLPPGSAGRSPRSIRQHFRIRLSLRASSCSGSFAPTYMYLTTTTMFSIICPRRSPKPIPFYEMFDPYLAELDGLGAAIVVTADHGMKPKHKADGSPDVIYVQDLLDEWLGKGCGRVICRSPTLCRASRRARVLCHRLSSGRMRRGEIMAQAERDPKASTSCSPARRRAAASSCRKTASATSSSFHPKQDARTSEHRQATWPALDEPLRSPWRG